MMPTMALCADAESIRRPDLIGLAGENLARQEWLRLFSSGEEARRFLRADRSVAEAWIASCDDVEPINLAFQGTGSLMSRATAAGIDASLTRQAFVERYAAAKRRHVPTGDTAGTGPGAGAGAPRSAVRFAPAPALTSRPPVSGHPAFVLPVVSGSGGAGKSTVAVLSALFSQGLGYRTLLLDFDLRFGDAHELVGVPGALAVDEALASPARLEGLAPDGLVPAVLAAPKRLEDAEAVVREAPRLLDDLRGRFDVVVANTGASWAEEHALLLERCSKALFLVDQRPSSLRACRHALELCSRCGIATGPFLFAANRCAKGAPLTSIDVSCALRGAPAVELRDGGGEVEELLGAGQPLDLIAAKNDLCTSLEHVLVDLLPGCEGRTLSLAEPSGARRERRFGRGRRRVGRRGAPCPC